MITEATAADLRRNLGGMLDRVQHRGDSIVIVEDGKPVAALVGVAMFERICRMRERFDALSERLAEAYARVPEDTGVAEIARAGEVARSEAASERRAARRSPARPARDTPEA